jgi:hypothetical protein
VAIKEFISLDGVEDVKSKLADIQKSGEGAATAINSLGSGTSQAGAGAKGITVSFGDASKAVRDAGNSTSLFANALHLLHPALQEAGVSLGSMRGLTSLAREGIDALALGLGLALVVAAAKAADEFKTLQANMTFLFGGDLGGKVAANVKQLATDLGTSAANIAPAAQSIQLALSHLSTFVSVGADGQLFKGLPQDADKAKAALDALTRQLLLLGETGSQAGPEVAKFFDTIGKIDPNTLKPVGLTLQSFLTLAPQIQQTLDNAFGGNLLQKLQQAKNQTIDFRTVLENLARLDVSISVKPIDKNVSQSFEELKTSALEFLATLGEAGATNAFKELSGGLRSAITDLNSANFGPLKTEISTTENELNGLLAAFQNAGKASHNFLAQGIQGTAPFGPELGAPQPGVFDAIKTNFAQSMAELQASASSAWDKIKQIFADGTQELQSDISNAPWTWAALVASAQTAFQSIESAWQRTVAFISSLAPTFQAPQAGVGGAPSVAEFAGGGHIRGPGSATSDSILAWLSNNEFVMRAASVRHYGVDMMHAINSMRLPKDFFRGFNMGGLVMPSFPSTPRFAQGGLALAGQSRSLTLVLDGKSFTVAGSKGTVDELERAADLHNLSRLGRAPGWVT